MKEDTRIAEPIEIGTFTPPATGSRSKKTASDIMQMVKDGAPDVEIAEKYPAMWLRYHKGIEKARDLFTPHRDAQTNPKIIVILGPTGTGKSRYAFEYDPEAYWKPQNQWWCGYTGQATVVLDEFYGWLPMYKVLKITDRYPESVEIKGGTVKFLAKTIIFTSNLPLKKWWQSERVQHNMDPFFRRITDFHVYLTLEDHLIYSGENAYTNFVLMNNRHRYLEPPRDD